MAAVDQLVKLMRDCLVLISGRIEGSGFFIAPGTVATCAHVAGPVGAEVTVTWRDLTMRGRVGWASELGENRIMPYPDLAVVELDSRPSHPAVWLDDQVPSISDQVVIFGHARVYHEEADQASGLFQVGGDYGRMIRVIGDEITPGMSGAPVLNVTTGGVCAVTKSARLRGQPAGGLVVPLRALRAIMEPGAYRESRRENDRYHRCNQVWNNLLDDVPGAAGPLGREADKDLRLLLAHLPAVHPEQHLAAFQAVAGDLTVAPPHPMYDYRDVLGELTGLVPAASGFPHELAYAIELSRTKSAVSDRLRQWARDSAPKRHKEEVVARLGEERALPADRSHRPSVIVCVRPVGADRRRYRCELWHCTDRIVPIDGDDRDRSLDELRQYLQDRLPVLVRGEQRAMIELVLPVELLDEEVEQWPAAPGRNTWAFLGHTSPIVVRDLERFDDAQGDYLPDWARRWAEIGGRDMGGVLTTVSCKDRRTPRALHAWYQGIAPRHALVLPRSPQEAISRAVLDVGLSCGIPVMIWRRHGCAGDTEASHDDCPGKRLSDAVTAELQGASRDEVPERIMRMRNRAEADDVPECERDVVLLWDDPGRRPQRPLLTPPTGEPNAEA